MKTEILIRTDNGEYIVFDNKKALAIKSKERLALLIKQFANLNVLRIVNDFLRDKNATSESLENHLNYSLSSMIENNIYLLKTSAGNNNMNYKDLSAINLDLIDIKLQRKVKRALNKFIEFAN